MNSLYSVVLENLWSSQMLSSRVSDEELSTDGCHRVPAPPVDVRLSLTLFQSSEIRIIGIRCIQRVKISLLYLLVLSVIIFECRTWASCKWSSSHRFPVLDRVKWHWHHQKVWPWKRVSRNFVSTRFESLKPEIGVDWITVIICLLTSLNCSELMWSAAMHWQWLQLMYWASLL